MNELTGSADQERPVGGAYGASHGGTEGTTCTSTDKELWAICPQNFSSALYNEFKSKNIGATVFYMNTIQEHEQYHRYLDLIKKHHMNLIIELPKKEEGKEAGARMEKHFSRVQTMASVANKVYIIAPKANGYWQEWRSWFDEYRGTYKPTHHHWCGLGIRDSDTGKPLNRLTLIYSNDHALPSHHCRCDGVLPHTKDLRQVRNEDEIARYEKSPYQKSNSEWASKTTRLLKLSSGGPYLTSDGSVRYGADFKRSEGKDARNPQGRDGGGAYGASPR